MKSRLSNCLLAFLKRVSPRKVSQGRSWPTETLRAEQIQLWRRVDTWLAAWQAVSAGCDLPGSARFFGWCSNKAFRSQATGFIELKTKGTAKN